MNSTPEEGDSPAKILLLALFAVIILASLLVVTQWLSHQKIPVLELREVTTLDPAKLPKPSDELTQLVNTLPPNFTPPPPPLELEITPELPTMPIAMALVPTLDISVEMAEFALNAPSIEVQALPDSKPMVVQRKALPRPTSKPKLLPTPVPPSQPRVAVQTAPKPKPRPAPKPAPTPPAKSTYSVGELDRKPQLRTKPKAPFPHQLLKAGVTSGTATLNVEIDTVGRVRVLGIASISHPELKPMAMQVARKARFTKPTKNGKPVKARFRWPLSLRK